MSTENRDYKYVLQDFTTIYLGARYSYSELIEAEEVPFKIKTLVNHYIKPEEEDLTLESDFYYMEGKGFAYQTFLQLKTKIKISILKEKKGSGKKYYATEVMKLQDFVKIPPADKEKDGIMIQEIIISKLALMAL